MPRLTEAFAAKMVIPAGKREAVAFDKDHRNAIPGFHFRKMRATARVYAYLDAWIGGKKVRRPLGEVLPGALNKLRTDAIEARLAARKGINWFAQRDEATKPKPTAELFADPLDSYLEARRKGIGYSKPMSPRALAEVTRHLHQHAKPLHLIELRSLTRKDVSRCLNDLQADLSDRGKGGRLTRDKVLGSITTYLTWCLNDGKLDAHPTVGLQRIAQSQNARPLSEGEVAEVWRACLELEAEAAGEDKPDWARYPRLVRLGILTVLRRENLAALEHAEVDLDAQEIRIPGAKMKNRRDFTLPLNDLAVALLHKMQGPGNYVFPGRRGTLFSGWGKAKVRLNKRINDNRKKSRQRPMELWVLHGLRGTFSTIMRDRGFASHEIIEECLSHVGDHKTGVAGDYNHATYARQKRQAMQAWGRLVSELVRHNRQAAQL